MGHWHDFAGLAKELEKKPFELLFANPFPFNASVYEKVVATVNKTGLGSGHPNVRFLHHANHPSAARDGPANVPGWNASNIEITARGLDGCYLLFGRDGRLAFAGRATQAEIEQRVRELLRR